MITINWDRSILKNMPRSNRAQQVEKFYECICHTCGSRYSLRRADAKRAMKRKSACKNCRLDSLAATFRQHLTQPEQKVFSWLQEWKLTFTSQSVLIIGTHGFIVDFLIGGNLIVEVDGAYFHEQERRQHKDQLLAHLWTGTLLRLDATEIMRNSVKARAALQSAILSTERG